MLIKSISVLRSFILYSILFFYLSILVISFFLSLLRKFLIFSISGVYNYQNCKQSVGAGINTLKSISDGLGPSIFCPKVEKARPMRGEDGGKVFYFPPESAFLTLMC